MTQARDWANLAWPEFEGLDVARTVAVLPVGAVEQHGPHLPVGVDAMIAEAMARGAAEAATEAQVMLLPTQPVGKSVEHLSYPGTLTLSAATLTALWTEIGDSVARAGLRKLVILNAHGGQPQVAEIVARDLRVRHAMLCVSAGWWSVGLPDDLPGGGVPEAERRHGIHAGLIETAIMLHLAPDRVTMDKARDFRPSLAEIETTYRWLRMIGPMQIGWMAQDLHPDGAAGDAASASAALGQAIVAGVTARLGALLDEVAAYPLTALRGR
jgi:creatinine amidohydrolase